MHFKVTDIDIEEKTRLFPGDGLILGLVRLSHMMLKTCNGNVDYSTVRNIGKVILLSFCIMRVTNYRSSMQLIISRY